MTAVAKSLPPTSDQPVLVLNTSTRLVSFCVFLCQVLSYAYKHNIASVYPEPKDKETFILSHIYSPDYDSFTLDVYDWPQDAKNVQDV